MIGWMKFGQHEKSNKYCRKTRLKATLDLLFEQDWLILICLLYTNRKILNINSIENTIQV